jgi:hypothetical protein
MQLSGPAAPVSEAVIPSAAAGDIRTVNTHGGDVGDPHQWYEPEHRAAVRNGGEFRHCGVLARLEVRSGGADDPDVSREDGPASREVLATA